MAAVSIHNKALRLTEEHFSFHYNHFLLAKTEIVSKTLNFFPEFT